MTFLRKQWLDNCGLDIPTTYEEYLEMLDAFSNGDPDGDGINGNTIGVSAAGFVGNEAPYTNYLPEFYQGHILLSIRERDAYGEMDLPRIP